MPISLRFLAVAAAASIAAGAAAKAAPEPPSDAKTIAHVLNRIAYGPRPGDMERVQQMGVAKYIDQQLHPERIADEALDARLEPLRTLRMSSADLAREYYIPAQQLKRQQKRAQTPAQNQADMEAPVQGQVPRMQISPEMLRQREVLVELSQQKLLRATYSERQLQEVLTDFWFNHFNVFAGKGADRLLVTAYERDVIRPNVLGKFRTLLGATAHSPAMLFYLDNWMSTAPDFRSRRPGQRASGLNENYGRELLELHTLGVDGGYTQEDVVEVARAFTGWTIDQPRMGGDFRFVPRMHDTGKKKVLGRTIDAGGERDGEQILDLLARHPSTAKFIATKLARRFVADEPPAPLVDRAAKRFLDTDGDLREVVRTILTSPEFFASDARAAKVKTPFEFVVSALRASSARVQGGAGLVRALQQLGMPLYMAQPPTGYADTADAWVNTGGLVARMNFAVSLADNRVPGVRAERGAGAPTAVELGSPDFQRK